MGISFLFSFSFSFSSFQHFYTFNVDTNTLLFKKSSTTYFFAISVIQTEYSIFVFHWIIFVTKILQQIINICFFESILLAYVFCFFSNFTAFYFFNFIIFFLLFIFLIYIFYFIFKFTILYWLCHISTWIHHRYTRVPNPEPSSLLPPRTIPLGRPSAPAPSIQYRASNLDWQLISYMILYSFQCHSPKSSHRLPLPLPQSLKDYSIYQCLFCCLVYRVFVTICLNSTYMR